MKIACLSGKGGAGKTFIAVNLAAVAPRATYIDCDVEEPNGRLFLKPENEPSAQPVSTLLPVFDEARCDGCKTCVRFCRFHALVYISGKPLVFPEICHSCGGCKMVCPNNAVSEEPKPIGKVELSRCGSVSVATGVLNAGEATGIPVIRAALDHAEGLTVIDCPPGSACSVMESVGDAGYCILVAEPTAFGFHNFKMVHELVTLLGKSCGVVVNKQEAPYEPLEDYCAEHDVKILARIPYDAHVASLVADGLIAGRHDEEIRKLFADLLAEIEDAS